MAAVINYGGRVFSMVGVTLTGSGSILTGDAVHATGTVTPCAAWPGNCPT